MTAKSSGPTSSTDVVRSSSGVVGCVAPAATWAARDAGPSHWPTCQATAPTANTASRASDGAAGLRLAGAGRLHGGRRDAEQGQQQRQPAVLRHLQLGVAGEVDAATDDVGASQRREQPPGGAERHPEDDGTGDGQQGAHRAVLAPPARAGLDHLVVSRAS